MAHAQTGENHSCNAPPNSPAAPMEDINKIANALAHGMTLEEMREKQATLFTGERYVRPMTEEDEARLRAYWQKVYDAPPPNYAPRQRVFKPEDITYDEARAQVWKLICRRAEELDTTFVFSPEQGAVVGQLIRYFINDPACKFDLKRGLYLYGEVGCGKTEIMALLSSWTGEKEFSKSFCVTNMTDLYNQARLDKNFDAVTQTLTLDRCLDDFLMKVGEVSQWGEPIDLNEVIIYQRNQRNQLYGQLTHIVSNHDPRIAFGMVAPRIADRLKIFQSVHYPGKSKR